jgi:hypothetical protein
MDFECRGFRERGSHLLWNSTVYGKYVYIDVGGGARHRNGILFMFYRS